MRLVTGFMAATLLLAACSPAVAPTASPPTPTASATASTQAFRPTFIPSACPDDVTSDVVIPVSCGYLTVLEDRSKPDGRTIELFVVRFDPPGGTTTPDPVITLGHLASRDGYGDMAGGGQRTHRVLYLMDPRGIGHSSPALDCPEVAVVGPDLAGLRLRDPARQQMLVRAVAACHDRLVGEGIDLAQYDLAANAADLDELRQALGITTWNLMSNGDASRLAFEVALRYPHGLRSLVIDSPSLPSPDFLSIAPQMLDLAISRLVTVCSAQPTCDRAYPDLDALLRNAVTRLDATPVTLSVTGTVDAIRLGHPINVLIDGAALLRIVRFGLADGGGSRVGQALSTVRDAVDGKLRADDPEIIGLSSDVGDCLGLLTNCERPTIGALYSILCRDYATQVDDPQLRSSLDGRAAYADVFDPSPLLTACPTWAVASAPVTGGRPLTSGIPMLAMRGSFDPFSATTQQVTAAAGNAANAYVLEIPNQSYNVLGYTECPRAIRNAWIDVPLSPPADTSCLAAIPPLTPVQ